MNSISANEPVKSESNADLYLISSREVLINLGEKNLAEKTGVVEEPALSMKKFLA